MKTKDHFCLTLLNYPISLDQFLRYSVMYINSENNRPNLLHQVGHSERVHGV